MQWNLLRIRKENNLLQKDIANILGISKDAYGMKERGQMQFTGDEMFKLSKYFGYAIEQIFLPRDFGNTDKKEGENNATIEC